MKKILFIIPLFLLVACVGGSGLVLDSRHDNEFRFSIHYKGFEAITKPDQGHIQGVQLMLSHNKYILKICKTLVSHGYDYGKLIEGEETPPRMPTIIRTLRKGKDMTIHISMAGYKTKINHSISLNRQIIAIEREIKMLEKGLAREMMIYS